MNLKVELPRTPVGTLYALALGGAILVATLLGGALWAKARATPAVYLVTGNDDPKVTTPGIVPDSLARDYARDWFVTLETYLPSTVDRNLTFLGTRVSPQAYHEFEKLAANVKRLVKDSKQASELFVLDPGASAVLRDGKRIDVVLRGVRRIHVENALLQEARVVYRMALLPGEPTRENPTGLAVAGFSFKVEAPEATHGK